MITTYGTGLIRLIASVFLPYFFFIDVLLSCRFPKKADWNRLHTLNTSSISKPVWLGCRFYVTLSWPFRHHRIHTLGISIISSLRSGSLPFPVIHTWVAKVCRWVSCPVCCRAFQSMYCCFHADVQPRVGINNGSRIDNGGVSKPSIGGLASIPLSCHLATVWGVAATTD